MDKTKQAQIKYVKGVDTACLKVNERTFRNLTQLSDNFFEIELAKKKISLDLPIYLGYFILQYAKLRMLEFYYDFMDVFIDRKHFENCEIDTDSAYIAISGDNLKDIIKPNMKTTFERQAFVLKVKLKQMRYITGSPVHVVIYIKHLTKEHLVFLN